MKIPMNFSRRLSAWIVLLLFASCQQVPKTPAGSMGIAKPYFDLKGYFDSEVARLRKKGKAKKMATVDGKQEQRLIDSIDFGRELAVFADSDINRPAWTDAYEVDSSFNAQRELIGLTYTSNDDNLKTRSITVDFEGASVSKILVKNEVASSITASSQVLSYQPAIGYSIESHQKVAMSDEHVFKIEVQFIE